MMLYGKKIKFFCVLLFVFSFLFLACCDKKNIEKQKSTTDEEKIQLITTTKEKHTEKTIHKTTEKEITVTKEGAVITILADNSGDNDISFNESEENESANTSYITSATDEPAKNKHTTKESTSQQHQIVTVPATDFEGWVTKWY